MVASEHKVGDREYFNDMAKSLLNVNAGNHIFHWLLRCDLTNFESRSLPRTAYKKELAAKQKQTEDSIAAVAQAQADSLAKVAEAEAAMAAEAAAKMAADSTRMADSVAAATKGGKKH